MHPEAQRIAIAEACGHKDVKPCIIRNVTKQGDDRLCGISSDSGWIPDYPNNLNAMHEAEKMLPDQQRQDYSSYLQPVGGSDDIICWDLIHATAAQRAEAFLRTLGLWKE